MSTVTASAAEAPLVLPAASVALAVKLGAVGQGRGGKAPGAAAVGSGRAQQGRAVIDLHRAAGRSRARLSSNVLSLVMPSPTMPVSLRERGDHRRRRGNRVDRHRQRRRGGAGVAGRIGGLGGEGMGAIGQSRSGEAPGAAAVGGGRAEQGRAVIDLQPCCRPPPCR